MSKRPMTSAEARLIAASIAERKAYHAITAGACTEDLEAWATADDELQAAGDALLKARGIKV